MSALPEPPPEHITVPFDDGSSTELTVRASDRPDSPVVLCLPAMGVTAAYYEILADALAEAGCHAVLADLRGTGTSSVRARRRTSFGYADVLERELPAIVDAACRAFGADRLVILGHSLGGQLGLLFAATSPRVSHVVLVASGSAWYRRVPGRRIVGRFLGITLIRATTLACGYLPQRFPFAGREARGVMRDWGHEAMTGQYRVHGSVIDYEAALARSTVPALFLVFPGDNYVPRSSAEHLAGKVRRARVTVREVPPSEFGFATTHHFRWVRRPAAVVTALDEFAFGGLRATREGALS